MKRIILIAAAALFIIIILALLLFAGRSKTRTGLSKGENSASAVTVLNEAKDLETKGSFQEAKVLYQKLINDFPNSNEIMNWQKKLEGLNMKLLFSPAITPKSTVYQIKPGDNLIKIAEQYKTTAELIKKSNGLIDDKILPGHKIKVWTAPFSIVVDKSQNTLMLKSDEDVFKTYIVSTGANNSSPTGVFKIVNKLSNPTWFKAGAVVSPDSPENILGTRWLGFNLPGYGIHGTTEPQSLGRQVTQGCVRMSNSEVEELYSIIPVGTEVTVVD